MRFEHELDHRKYATLPLPPTEDKQCSGILAAETGYIPEYGISFAGGEAHVARMAPVERQFLRVSGQVRVGNDGELARDFLLDVAARKGVSQTELDRLIEFLDMATNPRASEARQLELAQGILMNGIRMMVTPQLKQMYISGRSRHVMRPGIPRDPVLFVRKELMSGLLKPQDFIGSLAVRCFKLWNAGKLVTA